MEIGLEYRGKVDARHRQLEGIETSVFKGGSKPGCVATITIELLLRTRTRQSAVLLHTWVR